jgi:hypothetical protein
MEVEKMAGGGADKPVSGWSGPSGKVGGDQHPRIHPLTRSLSHLHSCFPAGFPDTRA